MPDLSDLFGAPFNPSAVEPQTDFQVLPPEKYPVLIESAKVKVTKKGNGHYIGLEMQVLDGPFKGRKVFDQINIDNPSKECVLIGLRTLSALGRALDLETIDDTNQLLNKVVVAHVKVKNEQNYVRTYSASGGNAAPCSSAAPPAPKPARSPPPPGVVSERQSLTAPGKPPWEK